MKAAVVGCGVVGGTMLRAHPQTVGYDIDAARVNALRQDDLEAAACLSILKGRDLIFVCVPTPNDGLRQDVTILNTALADIATAADPGALVVIRSTVLPRHIPVDYPLPLAVNPEFLRAWQSLDDLRDPPFVVAGVPDVNWAIPIFNWHQGAGVLCDHYFMCSPEEAMLLKYACNWFHAMKVSFANMIGHIGAQWKADSRVVMNMFKEDKKLNLSGAYLKPGTPFGGDCLPKDLIAGIGALWDAGNIDLLEATLWLNEREEA